MSALMFAAQGGHAATVELLLQRAANPTATNHKGQTAADLVKADQAQLRWVGQA